MAGTDKELFGRPVDVIDRSMIERDSNRYSRRSVFAAVEPLYAA